MIVPCVSFLTSIHVWILFLYVDFITQDSLMILLYSSNMILILTTLGRKYFPSVERSFKGVVLSETAQDLTEAAPIRPRRNSKNQWPKLYIKRWKTKVLDRSVEYPLDRIAYLTAKHSPCAMDCCFPLKNSQLKQLVKKKLNLPSPEQLLDDPHPSKMVTECFDVYVDRRSAFYRKRNVICGDRKQFTKPGMKIRFRETDEQESVSSPYSRVVDSRFRPSTDYGPAAEADCDAGVIRVWRKISRAFSR